MSNGVGVSRSERKEILLERIAVAKNKVAALTELAELIEGSEARSVSHQQLWRKVARRLRDDAAEISKEQDKAEARLSDITAAAAAYENHIPVRTRVIETPA